jgi:hypothetical protein
MASLQGPPLGTGTRCGRRSAAELSSRPWVPSSELQSQKGGCSARTLLPTAACTTSLSPDLSGGCLPPRVRGSFAGDRGGVTASPFAGHAQLCAQQRGLGKDSRDEIGDAFRGRAEARSWPPRSGLVQRRLSIVSPDPRSDPAFEGPPGDVSGTTSCPGCGAPMERGRDFAGFVRRRGSRWVDWNDMIFEMG